MIFLSGMSRSGTTLLQGLVCNSPQTIGMTAECSYLRALMDAYAQTKHPGFWAHAKYYWDSFEQFHGHHRRILDSYVNIVRDKNMTGIIVQKEPRLLRVWPELHDFWPKASYVIITRDPRDIVASQLNRTGNLQNLDSWFSEQMMNLYKAMHTKAKTIFVRYESLVSRPQSELEKLSEKLRIEIPLGEWESVREDDSCSPLDGMLPSPSSVGRWKQDLPKDVSDGILAQREWFKEVTGVDWFVEE